MAHRTDLIERTPSDHTARCSCGWTADPRRIYTTRQQAEDEVLKHERAVERARHHLTTRNPSLASQYDYYLSMAENPSVSEEDRRWWRILAVGLGARLGKPVTVDEQPELFPTET